VLNDILINFPNREELSFFRVLYMIVNDGLNIVSWESAQDVSQLFVT